MTDQRPDRAVTAKDYETLARRASDDIAIVRALAPRLHTTSNPPHWLADDPMTFGAIVRARSNVNVIVVPDQGRSVDQPQPTLEQLLQVTNYLDERRTITSRLSVMGPRYLPITVIASVVTRKEAIDKRWVQPGQLATELGEAIRRFMHPVHGRDDRKGWKVGQAAVAQEIKDGVAPDPRHGSIATIEVKPAIPQYHFPPIGPGGEYVEHLERGTTHPLGAPVVKLTDFELVCWDPAGTRVIDMGIA